MIRKKGKSCKRAKLKPVFFRVSILDMTEFKHDLCSGCMVKMRCHKTIDYGDYALRHELRILEPCFRLPSIMKKMKPEWVFFDDVHFPKRYPQKHYNVRKVSVNYEKPPTGSYCGKIHRQRLQDSSHNKID